MPIFSGFRVEANVKRAQELNRAAAVNIRQTRKDTALAAARAYWAVRRLALLRDVQAAAIDRLREAEAVTSGRVRAGLAPPIDQNRATLRRYQQVATLEDFNGQLREAAVQLAVSLGVTDDLVLVDDPNIPAGPPAPVESLLADARHDRPELLSAKLQIEAQHQAVRMARSNYFPQLTGFALFQYGNNPFIPGLGSRSASTAVNPFADLSGNLTLGATLTMNFFDTLNTYTATKDARYEEARLVEEHRRIGRVVDADVRTAHAKVIHLRDRRLPLLAARDVAKDNLKILEARYKNGDALVIEFLDAQVELANAELQLADATAQLQVAWLELDAALGRTIGVD